jgi:N-acetylmuramoyl-L-alanine amidase
MVKHSKNKKLKSKYLIRRIMCVLVLIVLLMITSSFMNRGNKSESKEILNQLVLSKTENGTIDFEENEFYKKYTINCTEAITNFKPKEDMDKLQITLDKSKISNIDIKKGTKVNLSEINFEEDKNLFTLNFVKLAEDENYVHLDYGNDKKILIFIKKKSSFKYKVVVDPGHGGVDVGAEYDNLFEKDLNLKISKYMVDNLRYNGCRVIFTRNTDVELDKLVTKDLNIRANLANDENADIFVSVHINSNTANEYNGVSTYYYDDVNYNQKDKSKLAGAIQKELLENGTWKDMGIHGEDLAVLRLTKMPSALVECGFITNYEDRNRLSSDDTLVSFGLSISKGIMKYLDEVNQ